MGKLQYTLAALLIAAVSVVHAASGSAATVGASTTSDSSVSIEVKGPPRLASFKPGEVTLVWDRVESASGYIIRYGQESVIDTNKPYPSESELFTTTGGTIKSLTGSTYYFALVAVDGQGNESKALSDELKVSFNSTGSGSTSQSGASVAAPAAASGASVSASGASASGALSSVGFSVKSANGVEDDSGTIVVEFTNALSDKPVQLKVAKTSDNADVSVASVTKDPTSPNRVLVKTAAPLMSNTSYKVTIVTASDATNKNIEEGVKGMTEFSSPTYVAKKLDLPKSLDASGAVSGNSTGATASGVTGSGAVANGDLPATGAKENLLVVVSLVIAFGIVVALRRRIV